MGAATLRGPAGQPEPPPVRVRLHAGNGSHEMRYVDIADGVHLRLDEGQQIDPAVVVGLFTQSREEAWAGVSLPPRTVLYDLETKNGYCVSR
ncbi:MAG: hypothetical protein ACT4NY_14885 [Pseudonocardiales bacterium]